MLPPIFSNLHNQGTDRDTTNEHGMNSIGIWIIYQPIRMLFVASLAVFKVEVLEKYEKEQYFCH